MAQFVNRDGLDFSAAASDACSVYDDVMDDYVRFSPKLGASVGRLFRCDPQMPMAHCLRGYLQLLAGKRELVEIAQAESDWLHVHDALNPRESLHRDALRLWLRGDSAAACLAWEALLTRWPRDFLALKLAQFGHFYAGDAAAMRDVSNRASVHWPVNSPLYGYLLGVQAFGYEECGDYARAEALGRAAVERNADDQWAVHAVGHCMEMQDRAAEGCAWLDAHLAANPDGTLINHLHWHRALLQLRAGHAARALADYDAGLYGNSLEYLDVCNDASLLLRLELAGIDPGHERWHALASRARIRAGDGLMTFCDLHYVIALASIEDTAAVERLLAQMQSRGNENSGDGRVLSAVGLALAHGIVAWRAGEHARAMQRLYEVRRDVVRIGGSHAQRELFELILINAASIAGRRDELRGLLAERLGRVPESGQRQQALAALDRPVDNTPNPADAADAADAASRRAQPSVHEKVRENQTAPPAAS